MKKLLLIYFFLCMCQIVNAQSGMLNFAKMYADKGDYDKAVEYADKALASCKQNHGEESSEYAYILLWKASYMFELGEVEKSIEYATQASTIYAKTKGAKSIEYAHALNELAFFNAKLGKFIFAIQIGSEAAKIRKEVNGPRHPDYAQSLNNIAAYNKEIGNHTEAVRLGNEAALIYKEILGDNNPQYIDYIRNLASYYFRIGYYQNAVSFGERVVNAYKQIYGEKHINYATSLNELAVYYIHIGNTQESIRLLEEAISIVKKDSIENDIDYSIYLANLANGYASIGSYEKAILLGNESLNIIRNVLGVNNEIYANSLSCLAGYYNDMADFQEAIRIGTESLLIRKAVLGNKHNEYAQSLCNLAIYNNNIGNFHEAIKLGTEALDIWHELFGDKYPPYIKLLYSLSGSYFFCYNFEEGVNAVKKAFELGKATIIHNIATMSPSEMKIYLETMDYVVGENLDSKVSYDALLLNKGLMLNAERGINQLVQESGDQEAINLLEHIRMNSLVLKKQLEKPIKERSLNTDSLYSEIEKDYKVLAVQSKAFGDFSRFFSSSWQDVRNNLKSNEAAIEFGNLSQKLYRIPGSCTRALILKHDLKEPIDIYLELDSSKSFNENILANWPTIQQHLQGITKVYFSPSGEMYSTPIENYISDGREYIRVSSTREVVTNNSSGKSANKSMKLYGGLKYDMTIDALSDVNLEYQIEENEQQDLFAYAKRTSRDAIKRVGFNYLKGTLEEVKTIESIAKSHKIKCEVLTGEQGIEESLRTINGKKYGILHFSTHGFYWTEEEAEDHASDKKLPFLMMCDNQHRKHEEDKSMTRSGLIFSGANLTLKGRELPEGMEDGIATAQEISHLDLRGCDLVVLSACQTGLGEVSSEGVFGLQRGFKKAGVKSLLMSLWKVDDDATRLLMIEFYKSFLEGKSKIESLKNAQSVVRQTPGFEDPTYWAGFILLDGLN